MFGNIQTCPRSVHPDWITEGSRDVLPCPWCALDAEPDAPAPYTEPRDGDRVLIERDPVEGTVKIHPCHGYAWLVNADRACVLNLDEFAAAVAAGRVRLVQAAAPTYEPETVYRDDHDDLYVYLPIVAPRPDEPFLDLASGAWYSQPKGVLVACDVVPREAT